nr:hypothetical protein [Mycoplasmatales bacterium]
MSRIIILVGEPGCGKTEFGLNLLKNVDAKKKYLVDLDYINPYFRGREHTNYLIENNIELLGSNFKGQDNVDMPAISADTKIPFFTESCFAVYDLAGGINGVNALKLFEQEIIDNKDSIELLYVANLACSVGKTEFEIKQFISQINKNCAIKVSGIVNNTHLMSETTPEF